MSASKLLVDSDIFFSLTNKRDTNHNKVISLNRKFIKQKIKFFTTNLVVFETATVLSHKISQQAATTFLKEITSGAMEIIHLDEMSEKDALNIFNKQQRENTSFVDCANMAVLKKINLKYIFSFDRVYKLNGFIRAGID